MNSDRLVTFTPSSIGSSSSFSSSKSSLFVLDDSQSDNSMPRGDISQYNIAASPSSTPSSATPQQSPFQSSIITSTASTTQKIKRAFGKRRKQSQDASSLLAVISPANSPSVPNSPLNNQSWPTESQSIPSSQPSSTKLSMNMFSAKKHAQANNHNNNYYNNNKLNPSTTHSSTSSLASSSSKPSSSSSSSSHPPTQLQPQSQVLVHLASHPAIPETNHLPPLPPPKPRLKQPSRPKSPLPSSPSNMVVAEYVRGVAPPGPDHPERSVTPHSASEETKERWRRSDSTMDSGHTVRPATSTGTPSESRRVSAYLAGSSNAEYIDEEEILWEPAVQSRPPPSAPASTTATPSSQRHERPGTAPDTPSKQVKRRSLSLTIPSTSSIQKHNVSQLHHYHPHVSSSHASTNSVPFTSFASAANAADTSITSQGSGISPASIVIHPPKNNNLRGRLAAWAHPSHRTPSPSPSPIAQASTSSPSLLSTTSTSYSSAHIRTPLTSDASVTDLHAVGLVRQMQSRVRSPSSTSLSNSAGHIRQAATSLTNNASAMALGLGKKAYEKVGRVWGGASSHTGSGSGSDTSSYHHPSPISGSPMQLYPGGQDRSLSHGPSAFNSRRSPNSSGSWSIPSQSQGSRSSSERDGRDTPSSFSSLASRPMGKLVRPPRAPSGLVFKRELWECVKDTKTAVSPINDPLASRMIPALIYRCVQHLHKWGLEEEGLFRISGRAGHVARLRNDFDGGADYDITDCPPSDLDPHAVASVFKAYLRELPDVILTRALSPLFENAINTENSRTSGAHIIGKATSPVSPANMNLAARPPQALRKPPSLSTFTLPNSSTLRAPSTMLTNIIRDLISRLPKENYDLLLTVVELIRATAARSFITKMPLSNLLLVFCPSLSMSPTLLRALCDVPSVWEGTSGSDTKISTKSNHVDAQEDQADEDESVQNKGDDAVYSDVPSENDNGQNAGEKETIECQDRDSADNDSMDLNDAATTKLPPSDETVSESYEPNAGLEISADEDVILIPSSKARENRHRQQTRRIPVPPLNLQEVKDRSQSSQASVGSSSSPSISEGDQTLSHSDSMTSLHSSESMEQPNSNSQTVSQVSLLSSEGDADIETGMSLAIRVPGNAPRFHRVSPNQSPKATSPLTEQYYNFDKSLPASPRTPTSLSAFSAALAGRRAATPPSEYTMPNTRGAGHKPKKSSHSKQRRMDRIGSLSSPSLLGSSGASVPSVVFPSIGASSSTNAAQAPVSPTALKKLTVSLAQRNSKTLDNITLEEESPSASSSPSKRMGRRPSLNLLFNMKHGSSGSTSSSSPRSRTPTISGPILFQHVGGGGEWEEVLPPPTIANTVSDAPPTLSLGMDSGESSLGWEDVFRVSTTQGETLSHPPTSPLSPGSLSLPTLPPTSFTTSVQPRPVAISQPTLPTPSGSTGSQQPTSNSALMASHRPTTEYLLPSNDLFNTTRQPETYSPATMAVGADEHLDVTYPPAIIDPLLSASGEESAASPDKASIFQGHELSFSPKGLEAGSGSRSLSLQSSTHSPPPHISFHLRGSSFEEDDWASAVLSITSGGGKGFD